MLVASTISLLIAAWVLHIWEVKLHTPMGSIAGDGTDFLVDVKTIVAGHAFVNDDIGAPFGTNFADFPYYWDPFVVALIWFLGLFTNDAMAVFNVVYILGYPICAATTYVALRWVGIRRLLSVFGAVLFTLLPYHFLRGQGHLILGFYWAVPFGAALAYEVLRGRPLLTRRAGVDGWRGWLTRRSVISVLIMIAVGSQLSYYAVMSVLVIAVAGVVRGLGAWKWRALLPVAGALAVVVAAIVVTTLPTLQYRHKHGTNPVAGKRYPVESERYALKMTQLFIPIEGHRIQRLNRVAHNYSRTSQPLGEGPSPALGIVLSLALIVAVGWLLVAGISGRGPPAALAGLRETGALGLLCFLIATVGGGSAIFAYVISPQFRAWNRMSIFIAFYAVLALLLLLRWLATRIPEERVKALSPRARAAAPVVVLLLIGAVAILDTTSPLYARGAGPALPSWRSDGRFVAAIERSVPPSAMILQLPYSPYPETAPTGTAIDYDLFRGYIHSKNLRWSYGAMKGRATDWGGKTIAKYPPVDFLPAAAAAGFAGVTVDRDYYPDQGVAVVAELTKLLGGGPGIVSADGRLVYFSLAPMKTAVDGRCSARRADAAASALLHPTNGGRGLRLNCALM